MIPSPNVILVLPRILVSASQHRNKFIHFLVGHFPTTHSIFCAELIVDDSTKISPTLELAATMQERNCGILIIQPIHYHLCNKSQERSQRNPLDVAEGHCWTQWFRLSFWVRGNKVRGVRRSKAPRHVIDLKPSSKNGCSLNLWFAN